MNDRDRETLAFLSGNRLRAMPQRERRSDFAHVDRPDRTDWHRVAMQQTLSGTNSISRTQRGSWQPQEEPTEVESKVDWSERSLHNRGIATD